MKMNKLFDKAKKAIDNRGGMESLKEDAAELKDVAKGKGSLSEKAKAAAAAIKEPGAPGSKQADEVAGDSDKS
ncbi:MAG: hypothetical protein ACM3NV_06855 [Syntrophothermus sp.]